MKNLSISIFICCALLSNATVWGAQLLTLQECLDRAKEHNPALQTAAWDHRIAEVNVRLASAANFPGIDAMAGYTVQQAAQGAKIDALSAETQQAEYATAGLSASYTIYDFGRRDARQKKARAVADATTESFKARQSDVSLLVIEAYYAILESGKLLAAATEEVAQVEEHRRVAQALFEEGVVTRNDLLQADVRLSSARQQVLTVKNRLKNSWLQLNHLTGDQPAFRADLDSNALLAVSQEYRKNDADIFSRRHDILALRRGVEASTLEVSESRSAFYPELFSQASLSYMQNDKALEQTIVAALIGIRVNLFDGFASSATTEKAVRNRAKQEDALRQAESEVRLAIDTAQNNVTVARERITVAESAIRQSDENLRINKERYRERVGTATEVLDAQTLVTQAKTDYYDAQYDYQVSTARLKHALGEL